MKDRVEVSSNVDNPHLDEMGKSHLGVTLKPPKKRLGIPPGDAAARNRPANLQEILWSGLDDDQVWNKL